ncbi:MAG: hypothetical protein MJ085_01860 [Clostridia bacterium]|nr:hypothetical protein [Clostridia bacterium]
MIKERIPLFLYILSAGFAVGFLIRLIADYLCDYEYGSAPFYVYVLVRFVEFIIPAIVSFIAARIVYKKQNHRED